MDSNIPEVLLKAALDKVQSVKKLPGEFLVGKCYEQGPLPVQKCTVLTIYYRYMGKNTIVYRWRTCTIGDNLEQTFNDAYSEVLAYLILNWEEVWNLINFKPQ